MLPIGHIPIMSGIFSEQDWVFENSVGFSGGNEKSSVGITASYLDHTGYVANSSYDRVNIGMGGSTKLDIGLNVSAEISVMHAQTRKVVSLEKTRLVVLLRPLPRSLFLARNWDLNLPFEDHEWTYHSNQM